MQRRLMALVLTESTLVAMERPAQVDRASAIMELFSRNTQSAQKVSRIKFISHRLACPGILLSHHNPRGSQICILITNNS